MLTQKSLDKINLKLLEKYSSYTKKSGSVLYSIIPRLEVKFLEKSKMKSFNDCTICFYQIYFIIDDDGFRTFHTKNLRYKFYPYKMYFCGGVLIGGISYFTQQDKLKMFFDGLYLLETQLKGFSSFKHLICIDEISNYKEILEKLPGFQETFDVATDEFTNERSGNEVKMFVINKLKLLKYLKTYFDNKNETDDIKSTTKKVTESISEEV